MPSSDDPKSSNSQLPYDPSSSLEPTWLNAFSELLRFLSDAAFAWCDLLISIVIELISGLLT